MRRIIFIIVVVFPVLVFAQTAEEKKEITRSYDIDKMGELSDSFRIRYEHNKREALEWAQKNGKPIRFEENGRMHELMSISKEGDPIYYSTYNVDAAESSRANTLHNGGLLGLNLEGQNMEGHVWDAGLARSSHQEYDGAGGNNRFSIGDGTSTLHYHSAHVTGTVIASGYDADAKGMAPQADAIGYEWNNDLSEATTAAANGMLLSNHSYGWVANYLPDWNFGAYHEESRGWDEVLYNAPYYLMVVAAGNDGNNNSANGIPLDGNALFDKLSGHATSKNNLVVANALDASIDANGELVSVTINSGSSEGPTDDYRIKPDITGNGTGLYSTYQDADDAYNSISGTSMASPNVMGTLLLLQQHYHNLNAVFMRAATLKGLALHTADDAGIAGPDAVYGWGLVNGKKAAEVISNNGNEALIFELTLNPHQQISMEVVSNGTDPLEASISWTDPAGIANEGTANDPTPALVNDLDIRITQDSDTYYPYKLLSVNSNGTGDNLVDPYEKVLVNSASGTYTLTVTHKGTLAGGLQDFTLIVSGLGTNQSPVANYTVDNTLPLNTSTLVSFTNLSTSSPDYYAWSFNPSTVTYVGGTDANSPNPQVQFDSPGAYSVSLFVQNGAGDDTELKSDYIHVGTPGLWTGQSNPSWSTPSNWHNAMVPPSFIDVLIPESAVNWPIFDGDFTIGTDCQNLEIENTGELTILGDLLISEGFQLVCQDQASILVEGDWIKHGSFIPGNSQVMLQGSSGSTIEASVTNNYSLQTTLADNNGAWGSMFDVVALQDVTIDDFEANLTNGTGDVFVYYKSGTHVGFDDDASAWTLLGSATVESNGEGTATPIPIAVNIQIPAGETYAFFIHTINGIRYTNGTGLGNVYVSDENIQILEGSGKHQILFGPGAFSPRVFNGIVHYTATHESTINLHNLVIGKSHAVVQNTADLQLDGDLEVLPGAWFTNNAPYSITIDGDLVVQANGAASASFIEHGTTTVNGNTYVEQYLSSERFHLVSAPLTGSTIAPYLDIYLAAYNEPSGMWTYLVNTTVPMNVGAGYSAWASDGMTGPVTISFSGTIHQTDVYIDTLSYSASQAPYDGYTLLGNPYPSALDWNSSWTMTDMSGWMEVYDNGIYKGWHVSGTGYNGKTDGIIPVGQGFWVRSSSNASSITIPASERTHDAQALYKNTESVPYPVVRLTSTINGMSDETGIIFHPESTAGHDSFFDLGKFSNKEEAPQLFSITGNTKYAMNFCGPEYHGRVIPVGFETGSDGIYTIEVSELSNFDGKTAVRLEDVKEGIFENLQPGSTHTFAYHTDDNPHRFNLHFSTAVPGIQESEYGWCRVWAGNNTLYIDNSLQTNARLEVYDILGQKILGSHFIAAGFNEVRMNVRPGYFLVVVKSERSTHAAKVFIK